MTKEDILKLKRYCQSVIDKPQALDKQYCVQEGGRMWCRDWEVIEICKYIFNGETAYIGDPPPNRLKNNPLWSKENIMEVARIVVKNMGSMDLIISSLKGRRTRWASAQDLKQGGPDGN